VRGDAKRLDKLDAFAERRGCGWTIDNGRPVLKHWSQEPTFKTLREAIDAMPEEKPREQ
jgi:hypothetical protein